MRKLKLAGFDMGRNYVAWAVVRGSLDQGFQLHRHGLLYPPDLGSTKNFGHTLTYWSHFFWMFLTLDLKPHGYGVERFVYRPGGQGAGAEDINLRLAGMMSPAGFLVRNTDWKTWFKRNVDSEGSLHYFRTPTEHEADAAGIALYTASVLWGRRVRFADKG